MRYAIAFTLLGLLAIAAFNSTGEAVAHHAECLNAQREARINAIVNGDDPRTALAKTTPCGKGVIEQ